MNRRFHARLARELIAACGGLEEAAQVCRIGKSQLSDAQNPNGVAYLPADTIYDLEQHCGSAIYSRALHDARPETPVQRDLMTEAAEATEAAARLQGAVRVALADGRLTPNETDRLCTLHSEAEAELREVGLLLNTKH